MSTVPSSDFGDFNPPSPPSSFIVGDDISETEVVENRGGGGGSRQRRGRTSQFRLRHFWRKAQERYEGQGDYEAIPFAMEASVLEQELRTSLVNGLTEAEARQRLNRYGRNLLTEQEKDNVLSLLWKQVSNAMTVVLVIALVISLSIKDYPDGATIAVFVTLNLVVGFLHGYKAERAMQSLLKLSSPKATIIRQLYHRQEQKEKEVSNSEVVVGDIVVLHTGQVVPADIRLFRTSDLQINEALLTGECLPALKSSEVMSCEDIRNAPLGNFVNIAYSGTVVTKGEGYGIVYATGMNTEMGKLASALGNRGRARRSTWRARIKLLTRRILGLSNTSPLQRRLSLLAHILFITSLILVLVVFTISRFQISEDVALYAVALALAMIPESLLAIITVTLARGVARMHKRHAVVRRLDAIETIGGVGDICLDKTGTLTSGNMEVRKIWDGKWNWRFTGAGYTLDTLNGECESGRNNMADLEDLIRCASLCNNAVVKNMRTEWQAIGDSTETALQLFAAKSGFFKSFLVGNYKTLDFQNPASRYFHKQEHPYTPVTKRMSVVYYDSVIERDVVFVKGSTESVLAICEYGYEGHELSEERRNETMRLMGDFASEGLVSLVQSALMQRVLAFAQKTFKMEGQYGIQQWYSREEVESKMTFLGLIGIFDGLRPEAIPSVQQCQRAGIVLHMLTGDHVTTATAIAKEAGIIPLNEDVTGTVMMGEQFDRMSSAELDEIPTLPAVIARCSPQTKVRMIEALQRRKRLTAMIGDGVNDSLSVKKADVGIAMGGKGSDVTRQAAEIVLEDDNFSTIVAAIMEGRHIFENQIKLILYLMSSNCAEVIVMVAGLAFRDNSGRSVYPLSPVQILWENLITCAFPAFGLGIEPGSEEINNQPPSNGHSGILTKQFVVDVIVYGILMGTPPLISFVIVVYAVGRNRIGPDCGDVMDPACGIVYRARACVFISLTILILLHAFEMKHPRRSIFQTNLFRNKTLFFSVLGGIFVLIPTLYIPVLNEVVFKMWAITWEWSLCIGSILFYFVGAETYKAIKRRRCQKALRFGL